MRDEHGRQYSRYSADLGGHRAKENVRIGRLKDIDYSKSIRTKLHEFRLQKLIAEETALKFFRKNKRGGFIVLQTKIKTNTVTFTLLLIQIISLRAVLTLERIPTRCLTALNRTRLA
jgi:hypothetical protein